MLIQVNFSSMNAKRNGQWLAVVLVVLLSIFVASHGLIIENKRFFLPMHSVQMALDILNTGFGFQKRGALDVNITVQVLYPSSQVWK